jgi:ABC-type amino acid transport system permease subunit
MVGENITGVVSTAVDAMRSTPLAVALLMVNLGFLLFAGYIAHEATRNTRAREQQHMELVLAILKGCAPSAIGGTKEP